MESVMFVAICLFSCALFRISEKTSKFKNLYLCLAIIILCWLSCVRDSSVGTDTIHYINRFRNAGNYGFKEFYVVIWQGRDILFSAFTYYFSLFSGANVYMYLFILEFLCIFPVVVCSKKIEEYVPLDKVMFFYITLIYPASMNIVRETIAASFFLLAWCTFKEKKYVVAILTLVIAYGFHHSIALVLLVGFFVELFIKIKNKSIRKIIFFFAVIMFILIARDTGGILTNYLFADSLISGNKIVDYYARFQKGSYMIAIGRYGIMDLFYRIIFTIIPIQFLNGKDRLLNNFMIYSIVSLVIYATIFIVFGTTYGYRITFFYDVFNVMYFSIITKEFSPSLHVVKIKNLILNLLAVSYFVMIFIYIGANEVMPFTFGL